MIRLILLAALTVSAATKKTAPPPDEEAASESPAAAEKGRLEAYLRERTERIKELHKAALKFMEEEKESWNAFWNKVKDDRTRFEVHVARQRLNLFESLSSLDPRDHGAALADFEKLQSKLIQSFEQTQRQKAADFFLTREDRLRAFAAQQERERSELQANADTAWRAQKSKLGGPDVRDADEPAPRREPRRELSRDDARRDREREKLEREREKEREREEKLRAKEEREREKELARREKERQREERRRAREAEEGESPSRSRRSQRRADEAVTFGPP